MSVIFLFIDGIGIGEEAEHNPFSTHKYEFVKRLTNNEYLTNKADYFITDDQLYKGIDANLGIEGLPQSGTGQTSLFCGENASAVIGKHFGPFPHSGIKHLLKDQSIFNAVLEMGLKAHFINAYPPPFFEASEKRNRWSCTTLMTKSAGLHLNTQDDIFEGRGITADIIQKGWKTYLNIDIPEITAERAANRLLNAADEHDLVLFEYYLTDKVGHDRDPVKARLVLQVLNEFIIQILNHMKDDHLLLITSDHGNLEDLSTKTHTRNLVPLWTVGKGTSSFDKVDSLIDVKAAILEVLA